MQSKATTVEQYLSELPEDRRKAIEAVRQVILENLDKDYEEGMQYGMIGYYVPHRVYPAGYHCDPKQPLPFAGLASQKNHMALYLMCVYGESDHAQWFRRGLGQDRQEARHGQVVRAVQEAGGPGARRGRRGDPARAGEEVHRTLRGRHQEGQAVVKAKNHHWRHWSISKGREIAGLSSQKLASNEMTAPNRINPADSRRSKTRPAVLLERAAVSRIGSNTWLRTSTSGTSYRMFRKACTSPPGRPFPTWAAG